MSGATPPERLAARTWRADGGRLLIGGMPPRRLRLSAAGAAALDALLAGDGDGRAGAAALRQRLRRYAMLDPLPGEARAPVTFVVPVRDGGAALGRLVRALRPRGEVLVVDDGSRDGSAGLARAAGATVVANAGAPGPAGARNTGAALAVTEFVAFVDADCEAPADWARPLAALLAADPELALVAPRVRSAAGPGAIAAYELAGSPLDMGGDGGPVGPGRRLAFVPSTALVARRSALGELGGFAEELRFGEDVDLVWRAVAAGWGVRYVPQVAVVHRPRASLGGMLRQRFEYGTSAVRLDRRHPGAAAPLRASRSLAPWLVAALAGPGPGLAAALALPLLAAARQDDRAATLPLARLALLGSADAGRNLARALGRDWLPLTLAAALGSRRGRRLAAAVILADAALIRPPARAGGARAIAAQLPLRIADNAAYCAGLWRGALAQRSARALLPVIS